MNGTLLDKSALRKFPGYGWAGLGLILVFWPLNWSLSGVMPITAYGFFPLWLGYCLTVDAVNFCRRGTSLIARGVGRFVGLFLVSAPVWWIFEVLNWRVQNWHYVGRELFSDLGYMLLSSLSFSTVIPAVFGTAELIAGLDFVGRMRRWIVIRPTRPVTVFFALSGLGMLIAMVAFPRLFFPFLWLSLYFIFAPINAWLGNRSLSEATSEGDWRPVVSVFLGTLICGFFWEFWNFFSFPKWQYTLPWGNFLHIFEMPLPGYGGYLPFGLELFAVYHLVMGLLGDKKTTYVTEGLFHNRPEA